MGLEFIDESLAVREIVVADDAVVYLRGILEASNGLATISSVKGGAMMLMADPSRERELDEVLRDLQAELGHAWIAGPLRVGTSNTRDTAG